MDAQAVFCGLTGGTTSNTVKTLFMLESGTPPIPPCCISENLTRAPAFRAPFHHGRVVRNCPLRSVSFGLFGFKRWHISGIVLNRMRGDRYSSAGQVLRLAVGLLLALGGVVLTSSADTVAVRGTNDSAVGYLNSGVDFSFVPATNITVTQVGHYAFGSDQPKTLKAKELQQNVAFLEIPPLIQPLRRQGKYTAV